MSRILLGYDVERKCSIYLDLDVLLRTRLLIQASSGKGKSWVLRRLCEQIFGKAQIIVIDPEGEYATLRESFDFVLVGQGGETPADPRTAQLLSHRLLELRASAVCDLYDLKPSVRHEFVAKFLDGLIEAPKNLRHSVVVIVDEAHLFCPEKGAGESIASEAMISIATRGRKRGLAAIFATQRLSKLRKDAEAELHNYLIGGTFLDVDRKRAADALGVYGKDLHPFFDEIKMLDRGRFYALGPALSTERLLVSVGTVKTTHPDSGSFKEATTPPPPPAKIKALLPQLADLPKESAERLKTEAELRAKIRELEKTVRQAATPVAKVQPIAAIKAAVPRKLTQTEIIPVLMPFVSEMNSEIAKYLEAHRMKLRKILDAPAAPFEIDIRAVARSVANVLNNSSGPGAPVARGEVREGLAHAPTGQVPTFAPSPRLFHGDRIQKSDGEVSAIETADGITRPQSLILQSLAQLAAVGQANPSRGAVAFFAGTRHTSSSFEKNVGSLKTKGLVTFPSGGILSLTQEGHSGAGSGAMILGPEDIVNRANTILSTPERRIFEAVYRAYPGALSREECAEQAQATHSSSSFEKNVGKLKATSLLTYPSKGTVKAADWLFF